MRAVEEVGESAAALPHPSTLHCQRPSCSSWRKCKLSTQLLSIM